MTHTHTPGPWLIGEDQCVDECWSVVTTSGGAIIANVNDRAERRANARLIAAAPDLLNALERLVANLDEGDVISTTRIDEARAAIAKARGRE